jgi:hypothetical protein
VGKRGLRRPGLLLIQDIQSLVTHSFAPIAARVRGRLQFYRLSPVLFTLDRGVLRQTSPHLQLGLPPKPTQALSRHLFDAEHHRFGTEAGADLRNRLGAVPSQETQHLHEAAGIVAAL